MVVGAGHRHDLRDAQLPQATVGDRRELGRVADRARRDDAALPLHQSGNRRNRSNATRVGQHDRGASELVGNQLAGARLRDQSFVLIAKSAKVQPIGVADDGDDQHPAAVLPLNVDGQPQVHASRDSGRRAVDPIKGHGH